jgi:endonuclease/exonuclease/phosphatase (EEP) superfamily protein YafD
VRAVALTAAWIVVAPLAALALSRLAGRDDAHAVLYAIHTLTAVLYLPAWLALGVAARVRSPVLGAVALLVVAAHVAFMWGDMPWRASPAAAALEEPRTLRLVAANARAGNKVPAEFAAALASARPDVLVVVEVTPEIAAALRAEPGLDQLERRIEDPRHDHFGSAIYTRLPATDAGLVPVGGRPSAAMTISVGNQPVRVVAVHTLQPLTGVAALRHAIDDLVALARDTAPGVEIVLAGDFNATMHNRPLRRLLEDGGLHDAHRDTGRGLARTWPQHMPLVPSFALLDRVLVSGGVDVLTTEEVTAPGSDHRAVAAELYCRRGEQR